MRRSALKKSQLVWAIKRWGENSFERSEVIWNDRLPLRFTLNGCRTIGNRSTLTLAWSSWIGRSSLGRTWVPSVWRFFFLMKFLVTELLRGSLPLPPWSSSQEKCSSPVMASPCTGDHRAYDLYTIEPRKKGSKGKEKPQCSTNQFLPRPFHACKVGDSGKKIRDSNKLRVLAKRKRQFQRLATTQGTRPFALGWSSTTLPTSTTILT